MKSIVLFILFGVALAAPQGALYQTPDQSLPAPFPNSAPQPYINPGPQPQVSRNVYVFDAPALPARSAIPRNIPAPKIRHNIVFIKAAENGQQEEPIIIPQNQEKTLVYVLSKNQDNQPAPIQFEEAPPVTPEVFYVHYDEGQNVDLPGGYDLESALSLANSGQGQLIEGIGGVGGSSGGFGGGFNSASNGGIGGGFDSGSSGGFVGGFDGGFSGGFVGGSSGGFDSGSSGGFVGGSSGGFDGGSSGGFVSGSSGGFDGGSSGGFVGGSSGGFDGGSSGGFVGGSSGGFGGSQNAPSGLYNQPQ